MAYFSLRCFEPKIGRYIIIGLNVLLVILGVVHFGFVGLTGQFQTLYKDQFGSFYDKIAPIFDSLMAFFVITAIIQIIASVLMILLALQVLGKDKYLLWVRIAILLLMIVFGFDFFVAVYSSMQVSFWNSALGDTIKQAYDITGQAFQDTPYSEAMYKTLKLTLYFVRFCYAEAILTWILAVPSIIITLFSLADQLITEENVYKFVLNSDQPSKPPKISPNLHDQSTLDKIKLPK